MSAVLISVTQTHFEHAYNEKTGKRTSTQPGGREPKPLTSCDLARTASCGQHRVTAAQNITSHRACSLAGHSSSASLIGKLLPRKRLLP